MFERRDGRERTDRACAYGRRDRNWSGGRVGLRGDRTNGRGRLSHPHASRPRRRHSPVAPPANDRPSVRVFNNTTRGRVRSFDAETPRELGSVVFRGNEHAPPGPGTFPSTRRRIKKKKKQKTPLTRTRDVVRKPPLRLNRFLRRKQPC